MGKKVAVLYDIHGNDAALQAVLEELRIRPVDGVVIGGDVAWGPEPVPVMDRLIKLKRETEVYFIRGNADREVAGRERELDEFVSDVNEWCYNQLSSEHLEFLRSLKEHQVLEVEGLGEILFVHGSPRSDEEGIRCSTSEDEIRPMLKGVKQRILVCGHTHVQFYRQVDGIRLINPGSVGLPSGAVGACWAILGPDVSFMETLYDIDKTAERIMGSGVPYASAFAAHIRRPPIQGP
ncbi:metallophosphoesterase family protein [Kroppenstedtia pulmonis]|uniref:Metallophosphoesterase family protein n=1 Tax=Kroppenstedtia pulmonis TaxID=1380685 RepID=A0A7D3XJI5_9BACL|nr:metallophosphoesterase family protein [Kroppenstedtia pulmonis]QKG84859.1 metallophosphoesterase family protein [Kroppenstedtia pulmonis]